MKPAVPDLATMDERCIDFDHSFPWMELWDYEIDGTPPTYEEQMAMKCWRCGETMKQSFQRMASALKDMLNSPGASMKPAVPAPQGEP